MDTRPPASEVTTGLTTTSDKIRALVNAGYDHVEITKHLGIRYQHVRNVLLRSGIAGGLRRAEEAEREPVEVDAVPAAREDTAWTVLTGAGFQFIGEWTPDPESQIKLDAKAPTVPGVYAFIRGGHRCIYRPDTERAQNAIRPISPRPQGPEDKLTHQSADLRNAGSGKTGQSACGYARAVRVAGTPS
jgi:hypothetical protein